MRDAWLLLALVAGVVLIAGTAEASIGPVDPFAPSPSPDPASLPDGSFAGQGPGMNLSPSGAAFIKSQEGFSLFQYPDANGYSIYYGHFIQPGETFNNTQSEGELVFLADVAEYVNSINSLVTVPLDQSQFDALVDFEYNEGIGALRGSTLLMKLNAGNYVGAESEFARWNISQGTVNPALTARRRAEEQMFLA